MLTRFVIAACLLALPATPAAQGTSSESPINDEYRITAFPTHPLIGPFTGFGYLGYVNAVDKQVTTYYVGWPGVIYKPAKWFEGWGGFRYVWNDVTNGSNTREFRPFVGAKVYIPNHAHMNLFNFTRVEWRHITTDDTDTTEKKVRLRTRFGFEAPLSSRPWDLKTMYLIGDLEPMWGSSSRAIETVQARAGLGYVANHHLRLEFMYYLQISRKNAGDPLVYTDNIFRLNFKIGIKRGLLQRLSGAEAE